MGFYFFRAIGLTMVLVVVAPDNFAIPADASVPRVPMSLARPALFERNDGQYVADVAFRAAFAQVDAAIHADGSFTVRSTQAPSGVATPIRFTLRSAALDADLAKLILTSAAPQWTVAFPIWLLSGPDGVWRIESM